MGLPAPRHALGAALVVVALTLAGCAGAAGDAPDDAGPPAAEPAPEPEPDVDAAPEPEPDSEPEPADSPLAFTAVDLAGAEVDVAQVAGEPVVLWFWAPWCTICRGEGPHVADVAAELDSQVTFVGIAGLGEVPAMQSFVADTGTGGMVHLVDDDGALWQRFGVTYQPAYAFVAADGSVDVLIGALGPAELADRAKALIG